MLQRCKYRNCGRSRWNNFPHDKRRCKLDIIKQAEQLVISWVFRLLMQITELRYELVWNNSTNNKWRTNWIRQSSGTTNYLWCFLHKSEYWSCGWRIGKNFTHNKRRCKLDYQIKRNNYNSLHGVCFTDANTGTAVGYLEQFFVQRTEG